MKHDEDGKERRTQSRGLRVLLSLAPSLLLSPPPPPSLGTTKNRGPSRSRYAADAYGGPHIARGGGREGGLRRVGTRQRRGREGTGRVAGGITARVGLLLLLSPSPPSLPPVRSRGSCRLSCARRCCCYCRRCIAPWLSSVAPTPVFCRPRRAFRLPARSSARHFARGRARARESRP